jgi:hypothetical protein
MKTASGYRVLPLASHGRPHPGPSAGRTWGPSPLPNDIELLVQELSSRLFLVLDAKLHTSWVTEREGRVQMALDEYLTSLQVD